MDNYNDILMEFFGNKRKRKDNLPFALKRGGRNRLAEFLGEYGFNRGVEIGVQWGLYSAILCKANPNIELYSIDPWLYSKRKSSKARAEQKFNKSVKRLSPFNATVIRKKSMDALVDFKDNSLDFVFIDGNHSFDYAVSDIIHWTHKVRQGGVIAVHDYYNFNNGGVMKAVDAYTHCHYIDPWYVTYEFVPSAFWFKP